MDFYCMQELYALYLSDAQHVYARTWTVNGLGFSLCKDLDGERAGVQFMQGPGR